MSLVRPNFESGASCWDPYSEGLINALDRVQKIAAKFAKSYERFGLGYLGKRVREVIISEK